MTFTSLTYILYLPIIFLCYWAIGKRKQQNILLIAASYFFYAWWDYRFCALMLISSLVDYGIGESLSRTDGKKRRRSLLILSLA